MVFCTYAVLLAAETDKNGAVGEGHAYLAPSSTVPTRRHCGWRWVGRPTNSRLDAMFYPKSGLHAASSMSLREGRRGRGSARHGHSSMDARLISGGGGLLTL